MSTPVRSLEDACEHVVLTLKRILKVNTLFIVTEDSEANYVVKAFNRQEPLVQEGIISGFNLTTLTGAYSHQSIPISTLDNPAYGAIHLLDKNPIILDEDTQLLLESLATILGYTIELENATVTDTLTGLYNRRFLNTLFDNTEIPLGVMFIDLNDFKIINDKYGHDFGDQLLVEIAHRLRLYIRKTDRIIRYGGDEFIICFQHSTAVGDIRVIEDKIHNSFYEPFFINDQSVTISASIGVSSNQGLYTSLKQLITDADQAMYHIKHRQSRK